MSKIAFSAIDSKAVGSFTHGGKISFWYNSMEVFGVIVDQISVFIENKIGALAEVTGVMGDAGIDLRALALADTTDFGVLRLIVDDPKRALSLLRESGFVVSVTQTLAVPIHDAPGGLAKVLKILAEEKVSVEYAYAFISRRQGNAYVILRVEDNDYAQNILTRRGIEMLAKGNICDEFDKFSECST